MGGLEIMLVKHLGECPALREYSTHANLINVFLFAADLQQSTVQSQVV